MPSEVSGEASEKKHGIFAEVKIPAKRVEIFNNNFLYIRK
jgi:hypothetical protein